MKEICFIFVLLSASICLRAQLPKVATTEWQQLFNGKDLTGWKVKISGHELNDNFANTFRVEDGKIKVTYDGYDSFKERFGHIFFNKPFSYYVIATEYRFVGDQAKDGPDWAFRNSGIMIHGQAPETMLKDQDFPISIEVQLLGGRSNGTTRTTSNLCTPGTNVVMDGKLITTHCINSTSKTFDGDQWVRAEVRVLGDSLIQHFVNGELVLSYQKPQVGGGVVNHFDPKYKPDGQILAVGSISLQSESHPIEFRKVELLNLEGCMDPLAMNYKDYYVHADNSQCHYDKKALKKLKKKKG
jgi:hypothetical protein